MIQTNDDIARAEAAIDAAQTALIQVKAQHQEIAGRSAKLLERAAEASAERERLEARRRELLPALAGPDAAAATQELAKLPELIARAERQASDFREAAALDDPARKEAQRIIAEHSRAVRHAVYLPHLLRHQQRAAAVDAALELLRTAVTEWLESEAAFAATYQEAFGVPPVIDVPAARLARALSALAKDLLGPVSHARSLLVNNAGADIAAVSGPLEELTPARAQSAATARLEARAERQREGVPQPAATGIREPDYGL